MAKNSYVLKMLVNSEVETKTKYIIKKPNKGTKSSEKIELKKYDPVTKKHHLFVEKRLPNPKS